MGRTSTGVYWGTFTHAIFQNQPVYLAATNRGLCRINWPHESFDRLSNWVVKHIPSSELMEDQNQLTEYVQQIVEYFDGTRTAFSLPLDLHGTAFQTSVWQALTGIPHGQTRSYSDIAEAVGSPAAVRAVGTANGANPIPIVVPCHRVIGKNAALTGFRGGLDVKERLLQLEGFYAYTKKGHARFQF
ncbi:MAG: cysteine methyltransferase [Bacilli bacterium]|nr:cysteine methyltransferase [Bacilli bacterium]